MRGCLRKRNQLVVNAVQYRREKPVLRFSAYQRQDQVILSVEDNGEAYYPDEIKRRVKQILVSQKRKYRYLFTESTALNGNPLWQC